MKHVAWESCPACGQPVHPVAGRCKHCKADLVSLRAEAAQAAKRAAAEARAAAATPLRIAAEAPTPPTVTRLSPASSTGRSTRTIALVALAVLALGVLGGVLAQKLYARGATPRHDAVRAVAATPPDQDTVAPGFTDPFPSPTPDPRLDPDQGQGQGGGMIPGDPLDDPFEMMRRFMQANPFDPNAAPTPRHRAPGKSLPDVSDVAQFLPAMVDVACDKLQQCGVLDQASSGMCEMMVLGLTDEETVERVHRGECRYDQAAAKQCLEALGGMTCDSAADPGLLMGLSERIVSCGRTLDCP